VDFRLAVRREPVEREAPGIGDHRRASYLPHLQLRPSAGGAGARPVPRAGSDPRARPWAYQRCRTYERLKAPGARRAGGLGEGAGGGTRPRAGADGATGRRRASPAQRTRLTSINPATDACRRTHLF